DSVKACCRCPTILIHAAHNCLGYCSPTPNCSANSGPTPFRNHFLLGGIARTLSTASKFRPSLLNPQFVPWLEWPYILVTGLKSQMVQRFSENCTALSDVLRFCVTVGGHYARHGVHHTH
ncbi:unnamed protein product, partial [Choristocarpus tenellus]